MKGTIRLKTASCAVLAVVTFTARFASMARRRARVGFVLPSAADSEAVNAESWTEVTTALRLATAMSVPLKPGEGEDATVIVSSTAAT